MFLASPGDVDDERSAVREVERRVNATFDSLRVRVRVVGWEQVAPEADRPQERINPLVHQCDVFLGLLNRRWGSSTGQYSSGFEEEFAIALRRKAETGVPKIGMFFAQIGDEFLADPGDQLKTVLSFQKKVRTDGIALYKQFSGVDHLATEVLDLLTRHALDLVAQTADGRGDNLAGAGAGAGAGDGDGDLAASASSRARLANDSAAASDFVAAKVVDNPDRGDTADRARVDVPPGDAAEDESHGDQAQKPGRGPKEGQVEGPAEGSVGGPSGASSTGQIAPVLRAFADMFDPQVEADFDKLDRDRIALLGVAFAHDEKLLDNHHVNRLYRRREELALTVGEVWAWERTHFADRDADRAHRAVPIWAVLDPLADNLDDLQKDLVVMALDEDSRVARGALAFMTEYRIRPSRLWETSADTATEDRAPEELGNEMPAGLSAAISNWKLLFEQFPGPDIAANYMLAVSTIDDLDILDILLGGDDLAETSKSAVSAIVASLRHDLKPLAMLVPTRQAGAVGEFVNRALESIGDLGETEWEHLLQSRNPKVSVPAALQLISHGDSFEESRLTTYLLLDDREVDAALISRAVEDGELCKEVIEILREDNDIEDGDVRAARVIAAALTRTMLVDAIAKEPYGQIFWEALTIHDPVGTADEARSVLDNSASFLQEKVAALVEEHPALAEHIVSGSKRAACNLLAGLGTREDTEGRAEDLARAIAALREDKFQTREAALVAIAALVDDQTADRVPLELMNDYWVTKYAADLMTTPLAARLESVWRHADYPQLQMAAAAWFLQHPDRTDDELEEATYDDDIRIRMVAIDRILATWNREDIIGLLSRYDSQDRPYWYNVIAAIDEHLFGYASIGAAQEQHNG